MTVPVWTDPVTDIPRDHWKRPLVIPPGGGKAIPYTRVSTFAGTLDDTYKLCEWRQRQVAHGLSLRPDLQLRIVSLGPEPDKLTDEQANKTWKTQMQKVCDAAMEAAKASAAATVGTSLHALTDRVDRGQDVGIVPEQYKPHLKAYEEATSCLTVMQIERFVACDELQAAGTFDRLVKLDGHPKLIIADTKTGDVKYGTGRISIQEAVYAHSKMYNHETNTRIPLGDIDLDLGLIIALDARTGKCDLIWVDIKAGWEAAQAAKWVRAFRSRKNLSRPFTNTGVPQLPINPTVEQEQARDLTVEAAAALEVAIRNATTREELVQLWTVAGTAWQPHHTEMAEQRKTELAQRHLTAVK